MTDQRDFRAEIEEIQRKVERDMDIQHKDGIPWHEAELPPWDHQCWVQTRGRIRMFELIERCACGGVRMDGYGPWIEINQTRKHRGETEPVVSKVKRPIKGAFRNGAPWQVWFVGALIVGWLIGFLPLWIFAWQWIGDTWAGVIPGITMLGFGSAVGFWRITKE